MEQDFKVEETYHKTEETKYKLENKRNLSREDLIQGLPIRMIYLFNSYMIFGYGIFFCSLFVYFNLPENKQRWFIYLIAAMPSPFILFGITWARSLVIILKTCIHTIAFKEKVEDAEDGHYRYYFKYTTNMGQAIEISGVRYGDDESFQTVDILYDPNQVKIYLILEVDFFSYDFNQHEIIEKIRNSVIIS